ncbi:MAG: Uncharacterized protein XD98_0292 [Microgenomates bacterium 39_6]|nr:MAG: Uncharacterized protein XD98_0292 [Microgenomates bacterium 39_6]
MRITSKTYPKGTRIVGVILSKDKKKVILVERYKNGRHYYVFPGGGLEGSDKTEKDALLREIKEETNTLIKIISQPYKLKIKGHSRQIFYICQHLEGVPLVVGEERKKQNKNDRYIAKWISVEKLIKKKVYPLEVRDWLLEDLKNNRWQKRILALSSFDYLKD